MRDGSRRLLHQIDILMSRTFFGLHFNRIPELPAIGIVRLARRILQLYHCHLQQKSVPPLAAQNIDRTISIVAPNTPPKRNIVLIVVNSASFFWFLSAALLAAGGGYVANHEACLREADQLIERRSLISFELLGRQRSSSIKLESSSAYNGAPSGSSNAGSSVPEFSKMTYGDVQQEWLKALRRVEYEELPDGSIEQLQREWLEFNPQVADEPFGDVNKPIRNDAVKINPVLESKVRKLRSPLFSGYDSFLRDLDTYVYFFQTNCTPLRTLGVAFGHKPQIVLASVSPLFENGSMRRSLQGRLAGSTRSILMHQP
jgi:hypothetical protein